MANVLIPLTTKDSGFIIPETAVVNSPDRVCVIRVSNGKANWLDIKKGRKTAGKMAVYDELNAGDQVVKTASEEIRNGYPVMHVKEAVLK